MAASRFALEVDRPTLSLARGETRLMLLAEALKRYRHCQKRGALALDGMWDMGDGEIVGPGEVWTTEKGTVFVTTHALEDLCKTLQIACSLNYRQIRILCPASGDVDLHGLFDFLLLRAPLRVILEIEDDLRDDLEKRLAQLELEYQPPLPEEPVKSPNWFHRLLGQRPASLDPEVIKALREDARFLLEYGAERDGKRMGQVLRRLRHLDDPRMCLVVMEAHRAFYESGEFESHKTYPREGDGESVAANLNRLYQWAQTPGWSRARKATTVPGVPEPWRPHPPQLKELEGPPPGLTG
jgi:hypothetical protein